MLVFLVALLSNINFIDIFVWPALIICKNTRFFSLDSPPLASGTSTPILWPVRRGANHISCQPLQKQTYKNRIQSVRWKKCDSRCESEDNLYWKWVAGINSTWNVKTANNSKFQLDQRGILTIRDVTEDDNGTTYRCTVLPCSGCDPESVFIILLYYPEKGKMIKKNL